MVEWYYRFKGVDEHGPIGGSQLLQLIRDGVVLEDTLIRKDDSNWVPSVEINGLWAAAGRPTAAFKCPNCGKRLLGESRLLFPVPGAAGGSTPGSHADPFPPIGGRAGNRPATV